MNLSSISQVLSLINFWRKSCWFYCLYRLFSRHSHIERRKKSIVQYLIWWFGGISIYIGFSTAAALPCDPQHSIAESISNADTLGQFCYCMSSNQISLGGIGYYVLRQNTDFAWRDNPDSMRDSLSVIALGGEGQEDGLRIFSPSEIQNFNQTFSHPIHSDFEKFFTSGNDYYLSPNTTYYIKNISAENEYMGCVSDSGLGLNALIVFGRYLNRGILYAQIF